MQFTLYILLSWKEDKPKDVRTDSIQRVGIAFLNVERHRDRRLWVDFVGGEALLSFPFLKQLVEYIEGQALKRNILVTYSITTNGTILNDEILAWLIRYKII